MIALSVSVLSLTLYGAFGPPFHPPASIVGKIGAMNVGLLRTQPCSFFVAQTDMHTHFFLHKDAQIEECVWDERCTSFTDRAQIFQGLITWYNAV